MSGPSGGDAPKGPAEHPLADDLRRLLGELGERLLTRLERHERALLAQIEAELLASLPSRRDAQPVREAFRAAAATCLPWLGPARTSTEAVAAALRAHLAGRRSGLLVATLRRETGFSAMQVHRALAQLEAQGVVVRSGSPRRSRVQLVRPGASRRGRRSTPSRRAPPTGGDTPGRGETRVLRAIGRSRKGRSRAEIEQRAKTSTHRVREALRRLQDAGLVERIGAGPATRYRRVAPP